jgi:flagellar hook-associated protein 2
LTEVEGAAKQQQIDTSRDKFESQLSDFGLLRSALATLQDASNQLGDLSTFNSKTAAFNDSTVIIPQELEDDAPTGDYAFVVDALAKAHTLTIADANAFADDSNEVGKGTMTFSFGDWVDADTFSQNADRESVTITIDDTNNSLDGLKDAINKADFGVQASVVDDGINGYKLVLTGPSGVENQMKIAVVEDGVSPTNTDGSDLSRFAFIEGVANQQLDELVAGQDSAFSVNGLDVTRSTNQIEDVIEGFTFSLSEADNTQTFTINIGEDTSVAEDSVRNFVESFTAFLEVLQPLTSFNEGEDGADGEYGSLYREPATRGLIANLRTAVASEVEAITGGFSSLTNVGIRTEIDGTLSIDEEDFRRAFDDNFDLVKNLFTPEATSSSDKITINNFGDQTIPGSYEVTVTTDPAKGYMTGAGVSNDPLTTLTTPIGGFFQGSAAAGSLLDDLVGSQGSVTGNTTTLSNLLDDLSGSQATVNGIANTFAGFPLDLTANASDYALSIDIDSAGVQVITPDAQSYANEADLAANLQAKIEAAFGTGAASVTYNSGSSGFDIVSASRGTGSGVSVATSGASSAEWGLGGLADTGTLAAAGDYDFTVAVDGGAAVSVSLTPGNEAYSTNADLATHLQDQINAALTADSQSAQVSVMHDGNGFVMTSDINGIGSSVSAIGLVGGSAGNLGLDGVIPADGALPAAGLYDFDLQVDGVTQTISLDSLYGTTFADEDALATAMDGLIDTAFGSDVANVSYAGGFTISANSSGTSSSVNVVAATGANVADLGLSVASGTLGDVGSGDYDFTITLNGTTSDTISLLPGSYADYDELAAHMQAQINGDDALQAEGASVIVLWDTDHFVVSSTRYGALSGVSFDSIGADALADLGLSGGTSISGVDVAGTVGGEVGFGVGNVLLPKLDSDPYGLSFFVDPGATSSTINFSRGFGGELSQLIDGYLESGGLLAKREESISTSLAGLDETEEKHERRMEAFHERMLAQFLAMERIIASLSQSGNMLDGILDRLPFTAKQN